jgi:hypothetical protein
MANELGIDYRMAFAVVRELPREKKVRLGSRSRRFSLVSTVGRR